MWHIICRTDPISGNELTVRPGLLSLVQEDESNRLTIYFESEANRQAYLDIPVEHPTSELSVNLDNPSDEYIDEG